MLNKSVLAAVAVVLSTSTAAMAGNLSDAGTSDQQIIVLPDPTDATRPGSLPGKGGVAVPLLLGLLVFGAIGAGGGS